MYLFSKLIFCNNCGKGFRGKMQRAVKVYICSTYNKNRHECRTRVNIKEEDVIEVIGRHLQIFHQKSELNISNVREYVQKIQVGDEGYRIYYKDGSESIIEVNRLKF